MSKIKELPVLERPREKALHYGVESLSNVELLAILISSGYKEKSAMDIAYELLSNKGLYSLFTLPYQDFLKVKGLKKAKAIKLAASIELGKRFQQSKNNELTIEVNSESIFKRILPSIIGLDNEHFFLIILNRNKQIIHELTMYKGIEDNVPFSINDVLCTLLSHKGKNFYIAHNHPNGILFPSDKDIELTEKLVVESRKLGITLIDHLIVHSKGYYSFLDRESHLLE